VKGDNVISRFDTDTALTRVGTNIFEGHIDRRWWAGRGPNGGYIAAIILRGLSMAVADPERTPRSLTVQYIAPPAEGPVRVLVNVERVGRSTTMLSARMVQRDLLLANALAAFARSRPGIEYLEVPMPDILPPEAIEPLEPPQWEFLSFISRYERRQVARDPFFSGSGRAHTAGWLRLAEPRILDYLLAAAFTDAWMPSVMPLLQEPLPVPTIDLTIHFRARLPLPGAKPEDFYFVDFRSRCGAEGFFEEDGEIWSRDGTLLVQSRQLALLSLAG
jgi:acyl-CoA thioesterase